MTLLAVKGVGKQYPGVRALDAVDFELRPGEIHALIGENGAGKSTLIKILAGAVVPDLGTITLDGTTLPQGDPLAARGAGVSIVYQELTLVPELTVAENIFLGRERAAPFLKRAEMAAVARTQLEALGMSLPPDTVVGGLSVAQQQMVEIARALQGDSKVLILDEPSATLSGVEVERLFEVLRGLRARGLGIVYVSHRLEELFQIADRVTVLRDGKHVITTGIGSLDRAGLIRHMVGRELADEFPARSGTPGPTVLKVEGLSSPGFFQDVSFEVRQGEIVGLAGLVGAGRTSVALALVGALPSTGTIALDGRAVRFSSPAAAIDAGFGYVTEDRKGRGLFPALGSGENIAITYLSSFTRGGLLSLGALREAAARAAKDFDLRSAGLEQSAGTLSGGNQQKLLLARYLLKPRRVLILDEPTRGIDVGAKSEIYALMNRLTAEGLAIVMISSELPEVLAMSDRIVVMHEGRRRGELSRAQASADAVMELATGGRSAA